jgi:hypothetical protein
LQHGCIDRRTVVGLAALAAGCGAAGTPPRAGAAPPTGPKGDDLPPPGHLRVGPLGFGPAPVLWPAGVAPVAMRIDKAGVDAQIEPLAIVDGVMQNPTGPWVVGWYPETGSPGQFANVSFSGHVDYWNVGPAVFWDLEPGDPIVLVGEEGTEFAYAVTWSRAYPVAEVTPEAVEEIVGPTKRESITLITCIGTFDSGSGEYDQRFVVRAERVVE